MTWRSLRKKSKDASSSHDLVACPPQSVISTVIPQASLRLVVGAVSAAAEADLSSVAPALPLAEDREWFCLWPGEHYAFLDGLVRVLEPELALDIGTYHGASALVMARHVKQVVTYDIVPLDSIGNAYQELTTDFRNVEQVIGDLSEESFYESQRDLITNAQLVLVDGPKDGGFEYEVVPRLIADMKEGSVLVLDDIRFANMVSLWTSLNKPRLDVGSFAHSSGTGVIFV